MAIAPVNTAQTPSATTASLALPATPAAGNILVAFIVQAGTSTNAPTLTGFAINATSAFAATATSRIYVGTKVAAGTETELVPTPGASGTIQGICYGEFSGATTNVDVIVATNNAPKAKSITSEPVTTTTAGDLIFACYSRGANNNGGAEPWTGTGPLTNVAIASTRAAGGYFVTSGALSAATFTANYTTVESVFGMLVVAIKPAVSEGEHATRTAADTITVSDSATVASAHPRAVGDTVAVSESAARQVALPRAVGDTISVSDSAARQVSHPRAVGDTVSVSESASRKASFSRTAGDTVSVSSTAIGQLTKLVTAGDVVTVSDSASAVATAGGGGGVVKASFGAAASEFAAGGVTAGGASGPVGSGGTVQGVSVTGGHQ